MGCSYLRLPFLRVKNLLYGPFRPWYWVLWPQNAHIPRLFGPWPGPAECLWNCPSELRQFSSCCLPLPKLRPPRPTFASLWRVVAAIAALFQVPWRRKTGVGKAIFSIGCCCLAYRWRRTRYFAYKIMTGTCFMTDLAP